MTMLTWRATRWHQRGHGRCEVDRALEQSRVPGARSDRVADVERESVQPGQDTRLLQVVDPVGEDTGGHDDQCGSGPREERAQVQPQRTPDQVAQRHRGRDAEQGTQQRVVPEPVDRTAAHRNRAVSMPSRATARNATTTSAPTPASAALSIFECNSPFRVPGVGGHPEDHPT